MADFPSLNRHVDFPDWQRELEAALRERDQSKRSERLQAAKAAIFLRLKAKRARPPGTVERMALSDAVHVLQMLRSESVQHRD